MCLANYVVKEILLYIVTENWNSLKCEQIDKMKHFPARKVVVFAWLEKSWLNTEEIVQYSDIHGFSKAESLIRN